MTPEEQQEIRERYEKAKRILTESAMYESMQDVPRLLNEVERLRGAFELHDRLVKRYKSWGEQLERENERLRGEIKWFMEQAGWADVEHPLRDYGLLIPSHEGRELYKRFRAALEGGENA